MSYFEMLQKAEAMADNQLADARKANRQEPIWTYQNSLWDMALCQVTINRCRKQKNY